MLFQIGRILQLIGMLILPLAIAGQATGNLSEGRMLMWAGVGVVIFGCGWMLQQSAGKK